MIVAPAQADIRGIAIEVDVGAQEGLPRRGVLRVAIPRAGRILCNWLIMLPRPNLVERAGALSPAKVDQLEAVLRRAELDPSRWAA